MDTTDYDLIVKRSNSYMRKYEASLNMVAEMFVEAEEDVVMWHKCASDLISGYFGRFSSKFRTFPLFSSSVQSQLELLVSTYSSLHALFQHVNRVQADDLKALFVEKLTAKVWVAFNCRIFVANFISHTIYRTILWQEDVTLFINEVIKFEEANESNDSTSLKWITNLTVTIQNLSDYISDTNFHQNSLSSHINYQKSVSLRISISVRLSFLNRYC